MGLKTEEVYFFGTDLCKKFFSSASGLSRHIVVKVLNDFSNNIKNYIHGNELMCKPSFKTIRFLSWMKCFLSIYSKSGLEIFLKVLSHWLSKAELYKIYLKETVGPHLSNSSFYSNVKVHFGPTRVDISLPQVRFSKYSSHSVCCVCIALNQFRNTCKTEADIEVATEAKRLHRLNFSGTRKKMEDIKQSAIQFPSDHLVIQAGKFDISITISLQYNCLTFINKLIS